MNPTSDSLVVRSHVARDLLQTAGLFKNERLVTWEYVVNGLQYVDPGTNPVVKVTIDSKRKRIAIADNGRGMNWAGLQNFFIMHGENVDRKEGRVGRGRFGTGKSAAFGIAQRLRITTVKNKRLSAVELDRSSIEKMSSGTEIPVRVLDREKPTDQQNGTLVEIEGVGLRTIDQASIIRYIERHLARSPKGVTVLVNQHTCEVSEPPVAEERRFAPNESQAELLGETELIVKVSKRPLEEDEKGIAIYSKGNWHETTLAGAEGKEFSRYIWGEIDVPRLEEDESDIPPFDVSRSMQLNPNNELVRAVYAFIFNGVEQLRQKLVEQDKARRATEDARRLVRQADEIAKIINADFIEFRGQIAKVRAAVPGAFDLMQGVNSAGAQPEFLLPGKEIAGIEVSDVGGFGSMGGEGGNGAEPRDLAPYLQPNEIGDKKGNPASTSNRKPRTTGGFQVKFDNLGDESPRAKYYSNERLIRINLDHPQIVAARGTASLEDATFQRLAYEVAFSEYAIGLAAELAQSGEFSDLTDPIVHIGETINRLARRGAHLYATDRE
jgi:hypothetical protein